MLDILLLGATGYTGRLITRYLAAHPQRETFTFGIAARSEKNSVVINAVGPFWRWGTSVVRACVRHGETPWVREVISEFDYAAAKAGCVVVPLRWVGLCTFGPRGVRCKQGPQVLRGASTAIDSSTSAWRLGGQSISGGTFSTMLSFLEDVPKWKAREVTQDFALSPGKHFTATFPFCSRRGAWSSPPGVYALPIDPSMRGVLYLMSIVNKQVVQRSWGLFELAARSPDLVFPSESFGVQDVSGLSYGPAFKYGRVYGPPKQAASNLCRIIFSHCSVCHGHPPACQHLAARWIARQLMPRSGEGPSDRDLDAGFVHITNITTSAPVATGRTVTVRTTFKGKGDPGYLLSSIMISEAALALVQDKDLLPPLGKRGGVLTPMTAFGDVLIQRLNACGRISIESGVVPVEDERMKAR
ncbi:hypothetical protein EDD16DRAFT_1657074 [Pisolithus croceorrhizus]|nr:hypothetical protein EDD16DRAFT_1657074 [Pisolithus croceorrhizus]